MCMAHDLHILLGAGSLKFILVTFVKSTRSEQFYLYFWGKLCSVSNWRENMS
jgi:hypothetical protein